jgi:hypothetical protein
MHAPDSKNIEEFVTFNFADVASQPEPLFVDIGESGNCIISCEETLWKPKCTGKMGPHVLGGELVSSIFCE